MIILATNRLQIHRAFPPPRARSPRLFHRLFARTTIRSPSTADSLPPAPDDDTARHRTFSARNKRSVALFARALITADALARILADDADVFVDPTRLARGRLDAADARALVARISEAFSFLNGAGRALGTGDGDGRDGRARVERVERPWARRAGNQSMTRAPGADRARSRRDATRRPCEAS